MPGYAATPTGTKFGIRRKPYPYRMGQGYLEAADGTLGVLDRMAAPMGTEVEPRNRLLAALPPADLARLRPHLQPVPLPRGKILFEADEPLTRVYFPEAAVVSIVCTFEDGTTAEMATVGREGVVGVAALLDGDGALGALLDGDAALGHCLVQGPGSALAVEVPRFRAALRESKILRAVCQAYAQVFFIQALQTVACNAVHAAEQRCARWLLMSHDRSDGDSFPLTQEFLAEMLGVRRSTVTVAAGALQGAGLIRYRRGVVTILDRAGLEAAACECHRIIRDRYERLLPHSLS